MEQPVITFATELWELQYGPIEQALLLQQQPQVSVEVLLMNGRCNPSVVPAHQHLQIHHLLQRCHRAMHLLHFLLQISLLLQLIFSGML